MEPVRPEVDFARHDEWRWPAWKFGMDMEDMFGPLERFNTYTTPLQEPYAFCLDIQDAAARSTTREELESELAKRQQQRFEELKYTFGNIALQLVMKSTFSDAQWQRALLYFRNKSLDNVIEFFSNFRRDNGAPEPSLPDNEVPEQTVAHAKAGGCRLGTKPQPHPSTTSRRPSGRGREAGRVVKRKSKAASQPGDADAKPHTRYGLRSQQKTACPNAWKRALSSHVAFDAGPDPRNHVNHEAKTQEGKI